MKKGIAFFDFDGTITSRDTLLEFIRFTKGNLAFALGFLFNLPFLVAFQLKFISNQRAKEKILGFYFRNTPVEKFRIQCDRFKKDRLPQLIRPKALDEIIKLQSQQIVVVVVSASPENWIMDWASCLRLELIASQLEVKDGRITGRISGKNCHGEEKVRRIMEKYVMSDYELIYAYGDSKADRPMLKLATHSYYRPFLK